MKKGAADEREILQNPLRLAILGLIIGTVGLINFLIYGKTTLALGSYIPWGLWVALLHLFPGTNRRRFSRSPS